MDRKRDEDLGVHRLSLLLQVLRISMAVVAVPSRHGAPQPSAARAPLLRLPLHVSRLTLFATDSGSESPASRGCKQSAKKNMH
jgi:hypothetical protein